MKIMSIVGARPQFIKAAAISRKLRERHEEILVHTGQHYDYDMSGIFFDGLDLPRPDVNLAVGSGRHGLQTGKMLSAIEDLMIQEHPDCVVLYGDTNSTLSGSLAASKLTIPIAHVEAGLRSFNRRMPEELNRVIADHLSDLLLCPSETAVRNLAAEGIRDNVHVVGDVMLDVLNWAKRPDASSACVERLGLQHHAYLLATVHRGENTDNLARLASILEALNSTDEPVVFPAHPRTRKVIADNGLRLEGHVHLMEPLGYLEMIALLGSARLVLTDSGGLQKEAYWLGVPCLTLREETEWVETVEAGWNVLVGHTSDKIINAVNSFNPPEGRPALYGDGAAADRCVALLELAFASTDTAERTEYANWSK